MSIEYEKIVFNERSKALIEIRKRMDSLFAEGKINKKEKSKLKRILIYQWRVNWNKNPDIPSSIKQAFNLLYA